MRSFAVFVRRINLRYWARHRLRTSLTVFGVAVGVTLVVAVSVINSTLLSTVRDTAEASAGDADIEVAAPDSTGFGDDAVQRIASVDGVRAAVPVLRTYTTLHHGDRAQRVLVLGTTYDFHWLFHRAAQDGALRISGKLMSHNGILLASETAEKLDVSLGDGFESETPTTPSQVTAAGTFSGELVERLETGDLAIMSLPTAQEMFKRDDKVDSVYVVADEDADIAQVEDSVQEVVGAAAIVGAPGARVEGFEETLNGIAAISSLAGTVALFVSAFVVFNTMSMSIIERRREISLTLALGATRKQVVASFVGEAAALGLLACAIGISAGFFLAKVMVQPGLDGLRVFTITAVAGASLTWGHVLLGLASGLGVAVLASYLPARRILSVAPVEALRPHGSYQYTFADAQPNRRRTIIRWIIGVTFITVCIATGPMFNGDLQRAAWTTNAQLVSLLIGATILLPEILRTSLRALRAVAGRIAGVRVRLAIDSLLRNSSRTTVTVGALAFTLGTVISVGGALDSYRSEWGRAARAWYGGPIQISSPSFASLGSDQPLPPSLADQIRDVEGVSRVYSARYRIVNIDGRQTTIYVTPYAEQANDPGMPEYGDARRDRIGAVLGRGQVVISALASLKKGLDVGDVLDVPTPTGMAPLEVGGIVNDLNPLDSMYMSNETFLRHWQAPAVDRYEVTIEDGAVQSEVIENIRRAAREKNLPVVVRSRAQLVLDTFDPIDQVFSVARAVQLVALIVAALAIANTMFITVIERRWELGLQRAVGMDGGSVTRTLLAEAGAIALVGAVAAWVVGLVTGWLMVQDMKRSYAIALTFEIPFDLLAMTLLVGGFIALLASAYPSRAALRTPIVEALRFE